MKPSVLCALVTGALLTGASATARASDLAVIGTGPMSTGGSFELRAGMGREPGSRSRTPTRCAEIDARDDHDGPNCNLELDTGEVAQFLGSSGYCSRHEAMYW